jgi:hypothetical protein
MGATPVALGQVECCLLQTEGSAEVPQRISMTEHDSCLLPTILAFHPTRDPWLRQVKQAGLVKFMLWVCHHMGCILPDQIERM